MGPTFILKKWFKLFQNKKGIKQKTLKILLIFSVLFLQGLERIPSTIIPIKLEFTQKIKQVCL